MSWVPSIGQKMQLFPIMVTFLNEWKIIKWDENPQIDKQPKQYSGYCENTCLPLAAEWVGHDPYIFFTNADALYPWLMESLV